MGEPSLQKPAYGSACNRCGRCCVAELCPLSAKIFRRTEGPCPALSFDGEKSMCGLVVDPGQFMAARTRRLGTQRMSSAAMLLIASGIGCDAQLEGEADNPEYRAQTKAAARALGGLRSEAFYAWGIKR